MTDSTVEAKAGDGPELAGWKLVPEKLTPVMIMAYDRVQDDLKVPAYANARLIWPAMLAAAPPPPATSSAMEALREAAEEFCRRVEAGEIRSKQSYSAFKSALAALAPVQQAGVESAIRMMVADHMTSEKHHPGYVLVPTAAFEMAREAIGETE